MALKSGTLSSVDININNGDATTNIGTGTTTGPIFIGSNVLGTSAEKTTIIGRQSSSTADGEQNIFIGIAANNSTRGVFVDIAGNSDTTNQPYSTVIGRQASSTAGGIQTISIGRNIGTATQQVITDIGSQWSTAGGRQTVNIGTGAGTAQTSVTIGNTANVNNSVSISGGSTGGVNVNNNAGAARTSIGTGTTTGTVTIGGIAGQTINIGNNAQTTNNATTTTNIGLQSSTGAGAGEFINIGVGQPNSTSWVNLNLAVNAQSTTNDYVTFIGTQNSNNVCTQTINLGTGTGTAQTSVTIGNTANVNNSVSISGGSTGGVNVNNNAGAATTNIGTGTTTGTVTIGGITGQTINIGNNAPTTNNATTTTNIGLQSSTGAGAGEFINIGVGQPNSTSWVNLNLAVNAQSTTNDYVTFIGTQNSNNVCTQTINLGTGTGTAQITVTIGNTANVNNSVSIRGGSTGGVRYSFGAGAPATLYPVGSTTAQPIEVAYAQITSANGTWDGGAFSNRFGTAVVYAGLSNASFTLTAPTGYQIWAVTFNSSAVPGAVITALPSATAGAVTILTQPINAVVAANVLVYLVKVA